MFKSIKRWYQRYILKCKYALFIEQNHSTESNLQTASQCTSLFTELNAPTITFLEYKNYDVAVYYESLQALLVDFNNKLHTLRSDNGIAVYNSSINPILTPLDTWCMTTATGISSAKSPYDYYVELSKCVNELITFISAGKSSTYLNRRFYKLLSDYITLTFVIGEMTYAKTNNKSGKNYQRWS